VSNNENKSGLKSLASKYLNSPNATTSEKTDYNSIIKNLSENLQYFKLKDSAKKELLSPINFFEQKTVLEEGIYHYD
jgi:hypothetical protein